MGKYLQVLDFHVKDLLLLFVLCNSRDSSVSQATALIQDRISQLLSDGLWWHLVHTSWWIIMALTILWIFLWQTGDWCLAALRLACPRSIAIICTACPSWYPVRWLLYFILQKAGQSVERSNFIKLSKRIRETNRVSLIGGQCIFEGNTTTTMVWKSW